MTEKYAVVWPNGKEVIMGIGSLKASQAAHERNRDDAALYVIAEHSRQEYLAALDGAVLVEEERS